MRYATNLMLLHPASERHGTTAQKQRESMSFNQPLDAGTSGNFVHGILIGLLLSIGLFWLPLGALLALLVQS